MFNEKTIQNNVQIYKQALLSFRESLATKCISLNNEQYLVRPTLNE